MMYSLFVQMNVGQSLLLHCGVLHLLNEALRRFEAWLVVCADFHCCLLEYVSRCLSGAMLNNVKINEFGGQIL